MFDLTDKRALVTGASGSIGAVIARAPHAQGAIVGLSGIVFAALLWVLARRRARAVNAALATHGDRAALPGGGLLFALGVLSGVGAALALVTVLGVSGLWS